MADYTPGPWVGFTDKGKPCAIMPAMRAGDVATFKEPPSEADFALMLVAPDFADGVRDMITAEQSGGDLWWRGYEKLLAAYRKAGLTHAAPWFNEEPDPGMNAPREPGQ